MNCAQVSAVFVRMNGGAIISIPDTNQVRKHLRECPKCHKSFNKNAHADDVFLDTYQKGLQASFFETIDTDDPKKVNVILWILFVVGGLIIIYFFL